MNHSFNVEIAKVYGMEKAVILENFYFWIKKNEANRKNIHEGRAYTYNTAEAYEKLFPYMKARRIAQLLREMENEDNLLISGQFGKYDRTKSYTLSDNALFILGDSNIQNLDNETYQNLTIKGQESVSCLNTDINTDINNTDINTDIPDKPEKSDISIINEIYLQNYKQLFQQGKVMTETPYVDYKQTGGFLKNLLKKISREKIVQCLDRAVTDDWIVKQGYNLMQILSSTQINKLLNSKQTKKSEIAGQNTDDEYRAGMSDLDSIGF